MTASHNNQNFNSQDSNSPEAHDQESQPFPQSSQADSNPPESDRWQELIAGYVLGDLSSEEMAQVQNHLASHPEAKVEVEELQATLNLLPLSLPDSAVPPATLNARLLASAADTAQTAVPPMARTSQVNQSPISQALHTATSHGGEAASDSPEARIAQRVQTRSHRLSPMAWGAIVAATAATFFGLQNLQLRNNLQLAQQTLQIAQQRSQQLENIQAQLASSQAELTEYKEMLAMLRQPENRLLSLSGASGFTEASSGSVVISPQKSWAVLTLKDLPAPPAGKAYQLWAMADNQKVYCIEFKPDTSGQVLVEIPVSNWASTPMVSITLENEGTIPTQTSEMIMTGTVI